MPDTHKKGAAGRARALFFLCTVTTKCAPIDELTRRERGFRTEGRETQKNARAKLPFLPKETMMTSTLKEKTIFAMSSALSSSLSTDDPLVREFMRLTTCTDTHVASRFLKDNAFDAKVSPVTKKLRRSHPYACAHLSLSILCPLRKLLRRTSLRATVAHLSLIACLRYRYRQTRPMR